MAGESRWLQDQVRSDFEWNVKAFREVSDRVDGLRGDTAQGFAALARGQSDLAGGQAELSRRMEHLSRRSEDLSRQMAELGESLTSQQGEIGAKFREMADHWEGALGRLDEYFRLRDDEQGRILADHEERMRRLEEGRLPAA